MITFLYRLQAHDGIRPFNHNKPKGIKIQSLIGTINLLFLIVYAWFLYLEFVKKMRNPDKNYNLVIC